MEFPELNNDAFQQALQWHRLGRLDEAQRVYEALLRQNAALHQAYYLLGKIWLERNDYQRADFCLKNAIELKPEQPHYLGAMADLLQAKGRVDEALNYYEASLKCKNDEETAEIRLNYGATLMDLGRSEAALAEFEIVARRRPQWAAAWNNLGNALVQLGRYDAAVEAFDRVLALSGEIYETHANLARLRNEIGQYEQAREHARDAIAIQPGPAAAWFQLGLADFELGNLHEAEGALQQCLRRAPNASGAYALLGQIAEQQGDLKQAEAEWLKCLNLQPRHAAVLGRMATRLGDSMPEKLQWQMESMFQEPELKAAEREPIGYGLAHLADAKGQFADAVTFLDKACQAREEELARKSLKYDSAKFETDMLKWNALFQSISLAEIPGLQVADWNGPRMVFIVGLPRSGTSLVEHLLASHSAISGAGELTWIPDLAARLIQQPSIQSAELLAIRKAYFAQLQAKGHQTPVVIDKLPDNIYYTGLIRQVFPNALILRCRRDLRDVALSCRMTRFMSVRWNSDWNHLVGRIAFYQRFVSHQLPNRDHHILEISYEKLVENLDEAIAPVFDQLELDQPADCRAFHQNPRVVRTASAGQVRRPLYHSSVGRWRNYEFAYGEWFDLLARIESV